MGRPTKLTPELQVKIVEIIRAGNYADVAAEAVGIGSSTYYHWLALGRDATSGKYRDFRDAVKAAECYAEVRAVAIVQKHMVDNWQAAMTYLERKFPDRWGRRERHEHTGAGGGPIAVDVALKADLSKLSDEELEELDRLERKLEAGGMAGSDAGADNAGGPAANSGG